MKILGAIIAGGQSTRFGSDKAGAAVNGLPLIVHVANGMLRFTDTVVVSGRDWRDYATVPDEAFAGEGPLAGLLAILRHGAANGFEGVLTAPCDALPVPDMNRLVGDGPAVIDGQWLFGFWPTILAEDLAIFLENGTDRSVRGWMSNCGARVITYSEPIYNVNCPDDLIAFEKTLQR